MDLAYDDFKTAMDARAKSDTDNNMRDIAAAADFGRQAGKVFVVGYCWGGSLAYWAACRLGVDAASSYYGISIADSLDEQPGCPVVYHFGEIDAMTPPDHVAAARPPLTRGRRAPDPAAHLGGQPGRPGQRLFTSFPWRAH